MLKIPVVDHWWQTETGWPIAANCMGIEKFAIKAGSPTKPVPAIMCRFSIPTATSFLTVKKAPWSSSFPSPRMPAYTLAG